jgi:hypothetical protein
MHKNDTMEKYVTERHPAFAPRTPRPVRRPNWTVAAVMQEARVMAEVALTRPAAPVFNIAEARIAKALAADPVLMGGWGPAPTPKSDRRVSR